MFSFQAMNTGFHLAGLTNGQVKRIESWFRFVETRLSRFKPQSELTALNKSHGKLFLASSLLYEVAQQAYHYFQETNRVFHPFQGRQMERLGYDRSFEKLTMAGNRGIAVLPDTDSPLILFHPGMKAIQLCPDVSLDLGGIAKGWSVLKAQQWLQKEGLSSGLLNGGGDIAGWGKDHTWTLGVANPFRSKRDIMQLEMKKSFGIATSNIIKRSWMNSSGERAHHLIDPTTGEPSQSDLVQVTMIASDVLTAEIYAKTFLLLGQKKGIPWLERNKPDLAFIAVGDQKEVLFSKNLHQYAFVKEVKEV